MTCLVPGCSALGNRRGMCKNHYKAWHGGRRIPGDAQPTAPSKRPWLAREDDALRQLYAQHPSPQNVPVAEIADLLDRTQGAIRGRAHVLGITEPSRARGKQHVPDVPCPACGTMFKPYTKTAGKRIEFCSPKCAASVQWTRHPHPRGALGMKHTDEAKATIAASSRRMWAGMPQEEFERRADLTRAAVIVRLGKPQNPERQYTRAKGGRRADLNDRFFRSGWEANYARWLNWRIEHGDIDHWDYEPKRFRFPVDRGTMSYVPDFLVTFKDAHQEWHEVKGWMTQRGATALKRFAKYFPEETLVLIDGPAYRSIAVTAKSLCEVWE